MVNRATTHTDLALRARALGIQIKVIHNASIINAVSSCGLQLYNFGQVVSLPFFAGTLEDLQLVDFGGPLHSLILVGRNIHELEVEYLRGFIVNEKILDGLRN